MEATATISVQEYDLLRSELKVLDLILKDEAKFIRTWNEYGAGYFHVSLNSDEAMVKLAKDNFELVHKRESLELEVKRCYETLKRLTHELEAAKMPWYKKLFE